MVEEENLNSEKPVDFSMGEEKVKKVSRKKVIKKVEKVAETKKFKVPEPVDMPRLPVKPLVKELMPEVITQEEDLPKEIPNLPIYKETKTIKPIMVKKEKIPGDKVTVIIMDKEKELSRHLVNKTSIMELSKRPYKVKEDKKRIAQGEVLVMYLRENSQAEFMYLKTDNGMFIVNGSYYHILDSCIYNVGPKRVPTAVIPEWSMVPLSRKEFREQMGGDAQNAQKLIIKSIEHAEIVKIDKEIAPQQAGNTKALIWGLIAVVVIIAIVSQYFGGA